MFYQINGFKIGRVQAQPSNDVRFFSQRQLMALATPEAKAELQRRAEIVSKNRLTSQ